MYIVHTTIVKATAVYMFDCECIQFSLKVKSIHDNLQTVHYDAQYHMTNSLC